MPIETNCPAINATTATVTNIQERQLDDLKDSHHDVKMRTTIDINDAILKELKQSAADTGRSFRQTIEETLAIGLANRAKPKSARKFRVRAHELNLKPGFRHQSLNQVYDQLEAEESAR